MVPPIFWRLLLAASFATAERTCLTDDQILSRTSLQSILKSLRTTGLCYSGSCDVQLSYGSWASHKVLSRIVRILVEEYLSYPLDLVDITGSTGQYVALSTDAVDVDIELWRNSAPADEVSSYPLRPIRGANGVRAMAYAGLARGGVYIRASVEDRDTILNSGRFYTALESVVMPRLPPLDSLLSHCLIPDSQLVAGRSQCLDVVNPRCVTGAPGRSNRVNASHAPCRAIAKETPTYEPGKLEGMIARGDLPLSIAYMGVGGTERLLRETSSTVLFYWYEPSSLIARGAVTDPDKPIRMYFDAEVACPPPGTSAESSALYPAHAACDFPYGSPEKGHAERLERAGLGDVLELIGNIDIDSDNLTAMLLAMDDGVDNDRDSAAERVACEWVQAHRYEWQQWLRTDDRGGSTEADAWIVYVGLFLLVFVTIWLCGPLCLFCCARTYAPALTWETWAMYPGCCHRLAACLRRPLVRCLRKQTAVARSGVARSTAALLTTASAAHPHALVKGEAVVAQTMKALAVDDAGDLSTQMAHVLGLSARIAPAMRKPKSSLVQATPEQLAHGVQWATRHVWGIEGDEVRVAIVRHESQASERLVLRVWGEDRSSTGTCYATVEGLGEQTVVLEEGRTACEFCLPLVHVTEGPLNLKKGVWQPERDFLLHVDACGATGSSLLGGASTCKVTILDTDDWPVPNAREMAPVLLFSRFIMQVFIDNSETEFFWLVGVLLRGTHSNIIDPLMMGWLVQDVILGTNLVFGLQLACLKVFLLFLDHYTYFHYNSNVGVSIYSPIRWMLSKWNVMPLELQLDHHLGAQYRTLFRRVDERLSSEGLATFTKVVQLCINILFSFLAVILVTRGNPYPLMCGYAVCLVAILFVVNRTVPPNMAQISKRFWHLQRTLDDKVSFIFTEMVAIACSGRGHELCDDAICDHSKRADESFNIFYITATQKQYVTWIMSAVPVLVFATAAMLVEFGLFEAGAIPPIIYTFGTAKSSLVELCSMREEWKIAVDLISQLSALLSASIERASLHSAHAARMASLIAKKGPADLHLTSCLSLHAVSYATADRPHSRLLHGLSGEVPLGELLGFENSAQTPTEHAHVTRMETAMLLFSSLLAPIEGVVLVPPHCTVALVPKDPGLIERGTVLENLVFGLSKDHEPKWIDNPDNFGLLIRLCEALKMTQAVFCDRDSLLQPMMQSLIVCNTQDKGLVALVRAMLPLLVPLKRQGPRDAAVLLIQDVGLLDEAHSTATHAVLRRFVEGHDFAGVVTAAGVNGAAAPSPAFPRRTVVWAAAKSTLARCGITKRVEFDAEGGALSCTGVEMPPRVGAGVVLPAGGASMHSEPKDPKVKVTDGVDAGLATGPVDDVDEVEAAIAVGHVQDV